MTERPGISIFDTDDPPASGVSQGTPSSGPAFPVARRGYDPTSVDRRIAALSGERTALVQRLEEMARRNSELEAELVSLQERSSQDYSPTYADLGGRASELLRLAEE